MINVDKFWNKCMNVGPKYINKYIFYINYLLNEFGTYMQCNRFDVGICIELIITDFLKDCNFKISHTPNAKRTDIIINNDLYLSIKYSSRDNITLHNSNSCINNDLKCNNLLILTTNEIYLISPTILYNEYSFDINDFLINCGDSLKLRRTIFKRLHKINYKYISSIKLHIDKSTCKNRLCPELFYKILKYEMNKKINKNVYYKKKHLIIQLIK